VENLKIGSYFPCYDFQCNSNHYPDTNIQYCHGLPYTFKNYCQWDGVTCDPKTYDIIALELGSYTGNGFASGLFGSLPTEIGYMSALTFLDLSGNGITGTLPSTIGSLVKLAFLDLAENKFSGTLTTAIGKLVSLTFLHLGSNLFSGYFTAAHITSLTKLTYFNLSYANFTNAYMPDISGLTKLQTLDARNANAFYGTIPTYLWSAVSLTLLDLSGNTFTGTLPTSVKAPLQYLAVGHNLLRGTIPATMSSGLTGLTYLDVNNNVLNAPLPLSLFTLTKLVYLDLGSNLFSNSKTNAFVQDIPSGIKSLTKLKVLKLNNNYWNAPQITSTVFGYISAMTALETLDLSASALSGPLPVPLPAFPNLKSIDLSDNAWLGYCNGDYHCRFNSTDFTKWNNRLSSFKAGYTSIVGPIHPRFFTWFGNLTALDLSSTYNYGEIPSTIGLLKKLQYLKLDHSYFSGAVPSSLCTISTLTYINVIEQKDFDTGNNVNLTYYCNPTQAPTEAPTVSAKPTSATPQ